MVAVRTSYALDLPFQSTLWTLEESILRFVVRRHHATRLHWDLRIEANGILYSWFMLRTPSVNPAISVWAGLQDPHDPKYILSERRIPAGQRGAGPTLVEEFGWLRPISGNSISQSQQLHEMFLSGRMDLWLEGKLLQGGYRLEGSGDDWHLRKLDDEFGSMLEPEWTGRSAISGKTLEEL
jgi:bifunctional non-homologous end joining protein LigD